MKNLPTVLIALAGVSIALGAAIAANSPPEQCRNFSHLLEESPTGNDTSNSVGPTFLERIDEAVTPEILNETFDCLFANHPAVSEFFGDEPYITDVDVYQFAFSEDAYGKILLGRNHASAYLNEEAPVGLKILKITFDYDSSGLPFADEFVGFEQRDTNDLYFARFMDDAYEQQNKDCLVCHAKQPLKLFFKSKFERQITEKQ